MYKKIRVVGLMLLLTIIYGCGGGSRGRTSSFDESNASPVINTSSDNNNDVKNSQYPEITDKNEVYVYENRREAFKINAVDNSRLNYYIAGKDFDFFNANILTGEVVFNEPCDYETKSIYDVEVVVIDSVGHTTTKRITIYVKDIEDEGQQLVERDSATSLTHDESDYFISTWKTDNIGKSNDKEITIPTQGDGYNYSVDWGDGTSTNNITYDATHTYAKEGIYTVKIFGKFPYLSFGRDQEEDNNQSTDSQKLLSIEQWGDIEWYSMVGTFANCSNLIINASDEPDLSNVTNISWMFEGAKKINQDISDWDVSNITQMEGTFCHAINFNQNISKWDVSNVTNMVWMFEGAKNFNQNISNWDVSNVINMSGMFEEAKKFNQKIANWDISSVTNLSGMFNNATSFNQNIGQWDVSNVTNMDWMFEGAIKFNQSIKNWDVSNVIKMSGMFEKASSFNQNIGNWDVSSVITMEGVFFGATKFNQDLAKWDVSNVVNMSGMFNEATNFNQNISSWDVSNVTNTSWMFEDATNFNQNLEQWDTSNIKTMQDMFENSGMSKLPSWYKI